MWRLTDEGRSPLQAGRYWYELSTVCARPCEAGAGDFSDVDMPNVMRIGSAGQLYFSQYRAGMRKSPPAFWAWHSYGDTTRSTSNTATNWTSLKAFLRRTKGLSRPANRQPAVYIDEVGVTYGTRSGQSRTVGGNDRTASNLMQRLVNQAPVVRHGTGANADPRTQGRVKGLFYYQLRDKAGDFDSGLIDPTTTNGRQNRVRPMWTPWCQAVITRVAGAACDPAVLTLDASPPPGNYD